MKVSDLIVVLNKCPGDLPVWAFWDGCPRSPVEGVFIRDKQVVLTYDGIASYFGETEKTDVWIKRPKK